MLCKHGVPIRCVQCSEDQRLREENKSVLSDGFCGLPPREEQSGSLEMTYFMIDNEVEQGKERDRLLMAANILNTWLKERP